MDQQTTTTVPVATLQGLISDIFAAGGCSAEEAACVARHLLSANLNGHDSHGVIRVPLYVSWVQAGELVPNQTAVAVVDAPG